MMQKAIRQENKIRFHSETSLSRQDVSGAMSEFLNWVKLLLPPDKYRIFNNLFSFPVRTVELTERIYSALEKIFDGRNPVYKYEFVAPEIEQDWNQYRRERLKEPEFWKTTAWDVMKTAFNSIMIVDLPAEQEGTLPEPYIYFLSLSDVIDFEEVNGTIQWIIFKQEKTIAVFDDASFRIFEKKDNAIGELGPQLSDVPHDLTYCPAQFFWTSSISHKKPAIKKHPISNQLGPLDWSLYFDIAKAHLDLYAGYPIYSAFTADCDFENEHTGERCEGGFLLGKEDKYIITRDGSAKACPVCSKKSLVGPGSYIEIDPPNAANDKADLRNPVSITTIDKNSLDYNVSELERINKLIYTNIVGFDGELNKDQAVNEKQIMAAFEGRATILKKVKKEFEMAQKWATETLCRLRYGNTFVSCSINYGTEFYLYSPEFILELYGKAKTAAFSSNTLDMLEDQYYETKFRNNPEQLERTKILINLDPFRHLSLNEVKGMYSDGQIGFDDYMVKVNFSTFIQRFERENTSLVEFGNQITFSEKINRIKEALSAYAQDLMPEQPSVAV